MPANIVVPEVGESIVEARVARWMKKVGDVVALGDPLVELETDKVNLEVPAPAAGVLSRVDHQDGADVKIGEVLGVIDESAAAAATPAAKPAEATAPAPAAAADASADTDKTRATPTANHPMLMPVLPYRPASRQPRARRLRARDSPRPAGRRRHSLEGWTYGLLMGCAQMRWGTQRGVKVRRRPNSARAPSSR